MRIYPLLVSLIIFAGCNDTQTKQEDVKASSQSVAASSVQKAAENTSPEPVKTAAVASSAAIDNNAATSAPQRVYKPETSPAVLFQKCAACHGSHAEKSALNQSQIIGEWDSKRIAAAIRGYQDGTYGGAMKALMHSQVKDLSRIQVDALSEYIANLYVKTH